MYAVNLEYIVKRTWKYYNAYLSGQRKRCALLVEPFIFYTAVKRQTGLKSLSSSQKKYIKETFKGLKHIKITKLVNDSMVLIKQADALQNEPFASETARTIVKTYEKAANILLRAYIASSYSYQKIYELYTTCYREKIENFYKQYSVYDNRSPIHVIFTTCNRPQSIDAFYDYSHLYDYNESYYDYSDYGKRTFNGVHYTTNEVAEPGFPSPFISFFNKALNGSHISRPIVFHSSSSYIVNENEEIEPFESGLFYKIVSGNCGYSRHHFTKMLPDPVLHKNWRMGNLYTSFLNPILNKDFNQKYFSHLAIQHCRAENRPGFPSTVSLFPQLLASHSGMSFLKILKLKAAQCENSIEDLLQILEEIQNQELEAIFLTEQKDLHHNFLLTFKVAIPIINNTIQEIQIYIECGIASGNEEAIIKYIGLVQDTIHQYNEMNGYDIKRALTEDINTCFRTLKGFKETISKWKIVNVSFKGDNGNSEKNTNNLMED